VLRNADTTVMTFAVDSNPDPTLPMRWDPFLPPPGRIPSNKAGPPPPFGLPESLQQGYCLQLQQRSDKTYQGTSQRHQAQVSNTAGTSGNQSINGRQVRFLERDPVPPSLRGREAMLEQATNRNAIVWVDGIRQHVPLNWLTDSSRPVQGADAVATVASTHGQGSTVCAPSTPGRPTSHPDLAQSAAEGDDDPITRQGWNSLLEACRELGIRRKDVPQIIAEATGIPADEVDPSRLTWRQYLQVIERLEADHSRPNSSPTPPPPPPRPNANRVTAKAIYPLPGRYLDTSVYGELVAIAGALGLDEEAMVRQLGIPNEYYDYLLGKYWIFAIARGLAAIALGQPPGPPDFSRAVLKFGYRSSDGPRLVVVGMDGTLLHGDPAMVADWARQLQIPL